MARSLVSGKASLSITATVKNTMDIDPSRSASGQVMFTKTWDFADGVDAEQASRGWEFLGTLVAGENLSINLSTMAGMNAGAGAGNDIVGQSLTFLEITKIVISNDNDVGVDGTLEIYPTAVNGWAPIGRHTVENGGALEAGGCLFKAQPSAGGFDISGSGVYLTLAAQYGDVDYKILVIGRHDTDESSSSSSVSSSASSSSSSPSSSSSVSSLSSLSSASSVNSSSSSLSSVNSSSSSSSSSNSSSSSSSSSSLVSSTSSSSVSSQSSSSSSSSSSS